MTGIEHPEWCGKSCDVFREGGKHRGMTVRVGDDPKRPLASVWLEQVPGYPVLVGLVSRTPLTPDGAARVSAAVAEVAAMAGRVRVG